MIQTLVIKQKKKLNAPATPSRSLALTPKVDKLSHVRTSMLSLRPNSPASSLSPKRCAVKQERMESPKPGWTARDPHSCCSVKKERTESPSSFKRISSVKETNLARMVNSTPKLTKSTPTIKQEPSKELVDTNTPRMLNFPDNISQTSINSVSSDDKSSEKRASNKNLVSGAERLSGDLVKLILTFMCYRRLHIIWYTMQFN